MLEMKKVPTLKSVANIVLLPKEWVLFDVSNILAILALIISLGIFIYQQRLSKSQGKLLESQGELLRRQNQLLDSQSRLLNNQGHLQSQLSRALVELELREKLSTIQSRLIALRTNVRLIREHGAELDRALAVLKQNPNTGDVLSVSTEDRSTIDGIRSGADDRFRQQVANLQSETHVRAELETLDSTIELAQMKMADLYLGSCCDKCQIHIRSLLVTAEQLARDSVYLLTDIRAVEAIYSYAGETTKKELTMLLSEFWSDPLGRIPTPSTYRDGRFNATSLKASLTEEIPEITKELPV